MRVLLFVVFLAWSACVRVLVWNACVVLFWRVCLFVLCGLVCCVVWCGVVCFCGCLVVLRSANVKIVVVC